MKKVLSFDIKILSIFFLLTLNGCNNQAEQDQATENAALLKVQISEATKLNTELLENVAYNKYNLKKLNNEMVRSSIKNVKSGKEMIDLWEKAGMTNAQEYYKLVDRQMKIIAKIHQNPEVKNMSSGKRKELIASIFNASTSKFTLSKLEQIKNKSK